MSSWFSSWLPGLPSLNFALPSSLQGRFISFVLKKSLGHFLKPGQLDAHQIDSQIGSGYVQVNDLELDHDAINALLSGVPIELHDGFISSATARIPWPNPLTSTLGFSLDSLHLTFRLLPNSDHSLHANSNLAESVASVAESFLHEELTPREETTLWESIHPDLASSQHLDGHNLPGSLDPFLAPEDEPSHPDVDPTGISIFAILIERFLARFEFDAVNTRITLVHSGNMSLTVSVPEIRYRTEIRDADVENTMREVQLKDGETRTLSISGLNVTMCSLRPPSPPSTPGTVSPGSPLTPHHGRLISPSSSSSSLDEETQFAMSQSLAFLPPKPASPASSMASSMYQSAISTADSVHNERCHDDDRRSRSKTPPPVLPGPMDFKRSRVTSEAPGNLERDRFAEGDVILSFGPSPTVIRLTTPSPAGSNPGETSFPEGSQIPTGSATSENLEFSMSIGVIACALQAWHIHALLALADNWSLQQPTRTTLAVNMVPNVSTPTRPLAGLGLDGALHVRGIVLLLLPPASPTTDMTRLSAMTVYFGRPLVPPSLPHGYVRLHLEGMSAAMSFSAPGGPVTSASASARARARSDGGVSTSATLFSSSLSLSDISLFVFYGNLTSMAEGELHTSPLLITDHNLPFQYSSTHHPDHQAKNEDNPCLPTFEVTDWTHEKQRRNGPKVSVWRSKLERKFGKPDNVRQGLSHGSQSSSPSKVRVGEGDTEDATLLSPAIMVNAKRTNVPRNVDKSYTVDEVEVKVVPLHIFMDLGQALRYDGVLAFLDEVVGSDVDASRSAKFDNDRSDDEVDGVDDYRNTPPATPRAHDLREREMERRRLERLILEDLDLDFDYRGNQSKPRGGAVKGQEKRKPRSSIPQITSKISVTFSMIRLELRCPPPPDKGPRSGALVIDLHAVTIVNGPSLTKPAARFATLDPDHLLPTPVSRASDGNLLVGAEVGRIVLACSLMGERTATVIASLGSLDSTHDTPSYRTGSQPPLPLKPRISISKPKPTARSAFLHSSVSAVLALSIDVPSIHADVSKDILDGVQYWADDVAQLVERAIGKNAGEGNTEGTDSHDTSLIGSRFFAKSRSGSGSALTATPQDTASEIVVKLVIAEVFVRLKVPRESEQTSPLRPLDISASDVDILIELKPEGKNETVITLGVMDLTVKNATSAGTVATLLSLTAPRSLSAAPKPLLKLRFTSLVVPETTAKESRVKLTLWGFTCNLHPDIRWVSDIGLFMKSPPGAFEAVIPSERTRIALKISEGSIRAFAPNHPGSVLVYVGDLDFSTDVVGGSPDSSFCLLVSALSLLAIDDLSDYASEVGTTILPTGIAFWKRAGYALLAEIADLDMNLKNTNADTIPDIRVVIDRIGLQIHLCADSLAAVAAFASDLSSAFRPESERTPKPKREPTMVSEHFSDSSGMMSSIEDLAFKRVPDVGAAPDMISDDLPTNLDYLDESFGAAAGLRELRDDDLDEFDVGETDTDRAHTTAVGSQATGIVSSVGGETIKIIRPEGIQIVEDYYDTLPSDAADGVPEFGDTTLRMRIRNSDITLFLYDGYDWARTRKTIEEEVKEMRRRLAKIRQLVASGQTQDSSVEETSALLFNSVYIGLEQDVDALAPAALLAAIDEELKDDFETASQSSWQSLRPPTGGKPRNRSTRVHGKRLTRSKAPGIEFRLFGLYAEIDQYCPDETMVSRTFATVRDLEILDHIKTSTWKKFLTELRSDSRGNVRETESNMVRIDLRSVRPVPGHPSEEARLRAKILPLRLHVDQDALDFLKNFFNFKDSQVASAVNTDSGDGDIYFQLAEIFPVDLKLDYKPRRVDYRALREGKTIELMNFFHFDGAEMTLRHITLAGITGWPRLFDTLNDLWTPDVKATQLVEVISGVAPIRSFVNVGSGVADLVLLPIAQYKKDGRIVRGVQKGTTAFVKSTAIEAIKLGARLATGTQVILEQAEGVLGGQFKHPVTTETLQVPSSDDEFVQRTDPGDDGELADLISKYAEQPMDIKEGVQSAYKSLRRNFNSAAQTILAVPMEVYERSGDEGPVRAVIRAVPIAVLKPMIGASEAVSKTLLGLHNTLDPNVRHDNDAKYKHR